MDENYKEDKDDGKENLLSGLTIQKVSERIDNLIETENMKELVILKDRMLKYKKEIEDKINLKIPIEHEVFKQHLYGQLEKNLLFAIYIKNNDMRADKIRQVYRWYCDKMEKWKSLDKIKYRTDKNVDEKYKPEEIHSDDIIIKDDEYELREFKLHRTDIPGLEPPKERLRDYKTKQIKPTKKFRKDEKVMENLRFNLDRFHGRVGSANNMIQLKQPINYYGKTGSLWNNPSQVAMNNENRPLNPKREIKSAYAFNRPECDLKQLNIEKEIHHAKNIEIREKRSQEEIKLFMDEAAMAKAKYKEKRETKFSIDNIIKEYEKTFKVDKSTEQLINEQIKNAENSENNKLSEFKNSNNNYSQMQYDQIDMKKISPKFPNCYTNVNNKVIFTGVENTQDLIAQKDANNQKEQNANSNNDKKNNNDNNIDENLEENKKQVDLKELIIDKQEIKNENVSLKPSKSEIFAKLKDEQEKTNKFKYDTVAFEVVHNPVLKTRIQSAKMCNVKEIDPKKLRYTEYCIPLSAYDEVNYKSYTEKFTKPKPKYTRPKTASEFAIRNFKKYENNYLALRQEMTKYYDQEKDKMNKLLYDKIDKQESEETSLPNVHQGRGKSVGRTASAAINEKKKEGLMFNSTFDQMFERPIEGPPRSIYYLPQPGKILMKKPPPIKTKKGKKKKKKKK